MVSSHSNTNPNENNTQIIHFTSDETWKNILKEKKVMKNPSVFIKKWEMPPMEIREDEKQIKQ